MKQEDHTLRVKKHESCSSQFRFLFFSGSATMAPTEVKDMLGARIAALRRQAGELKTLEDLAALCLAVIQAEEAEA